MTFTVDEMTTYYPRIRFGSNRDIEACQKIARQHSKWLPFVMCGNLQRGVDKRELFVAEVADEVVGFCNWHARQDGWNTVYDLAVVRAYQERGVGRMLLYSVPCPIALRCTTDNPANKFYINAGMRLVGMQTGKKLRDLNLYEMRILNVIVRGNKPNVPEIARKTGNAYGVHYDHSCHAWPFMVDSDPERCDWTEMMKVVHEYHPVQVLTADYYEGKRDEMLAQVQDLRNAEVLRIAVCPKFHGAIKDIPQDCIVAVSLKTNGKLAKRRNKYVGFMPDFEELRGRRVHLLGGAPRLQKDTLVKLQAVGVQVLSVDGNSQFGSAEKGSAWIDGRWRRKEGEAVNAEHTQILSSRNIQGELNSAAEWKQEPLF